MALKEYKLPNGILYVNTGDIIEHIIDGGNPIKIMPKKAYMSGNLRGVPIEEYFACPEIWDAKWEIHQAVEKKGKTVVAIDARKVTKFGDQIMLTILPKAYKEDLADKATIDIMVPKGYEGIWKNNPHVRHVTSEKVEDEEYDRIMDVTTLGLKFRRREEDNCTDAIINGLGLILINKTPIYNITKEEKEWARKELEKDKKKGLSIGKRLIGVSLYSAVKSRTYPAMIEVASKLGDKGYGLVMLDCQDEEGNYRWTFRQMASLMDLCDLVVTTDSALLHLAGALKKRIVGLFGYTEGYVFTECYEKASYIQASCPYGEKPCWWDIKCIPGPKSHLARTDKDYSHCLKQLDPKEVVEKVVEQFTEPKNLLLVMLTYNALDMTKRSIESIRSYHNYDLFVVDNDSTDGTKEWLKEQDIEFVSKKTSVAGAQNIGIKKFKEGNYNYIVFLNNDIVLRYDMLNELVSCAERSGAYGVMGNQVAISWRVDAIKPKDDGWDEIVDIPAGSYSATLFTKECFDKVGLFNERYEPRYIEDNDFTIRIRANRGKFVKSHSAIFWHYLGAVVKTVEAGRSEEHAKIWDNNIGIFTEMYGIHPHEAQDLRKLGLEWHRGDWFGNIFHLLENQGFVNIRVERRMGGYGDILFTTVVAKALKALFLKDKLEINYFVPKQFIPLLENNPNINGAYDYSNTWRANFLIDLTDLEFRVELQEMQKYGHIKSARTEIYLSVLGLDKHLPKDNGWLKPDYFVTEAEKRWAEGWWNEFLLKEKRKKRIVFVHRGSNKLKHWIYAKDLFNRLVKDGYGVFPLDDESGSFKYDFRKASAMVATSDLVVSPDSGISNLAGALDIPVLTIFSNRNGENFVKMFSSMRAVQGHCSHREEDFCDFFCPCLGGGAHRSKENRTVPDCLKNLKEKKIYSIIKDMLNGHDI